MPFFCLYNFVALTIKLIFVVVLYLLSFVMCLSCVFWGNVMGRSSSHVRSVFSRQEAYVHSLTQHSEWFTRRFNTVHVDPSPRTYTYLRSYSHYSAHRTGFGNQCDSSQPWRRFPFHCSSLADCLLAAEGLWRKWGIGYLDYLCQFKTLWRF